MAAGRCRAAAGARGYPDEGDGPRAVAAHCHRAVTLSEAKGTEAPVELRPLSCRPRREAGCARQSRRAQLEFRSMGRPFASFGAVHNILSPFFNPHTQDRKSTRL